MPLIILMLLLLAPLFELWLLIEVGGEIGGFLTVALCLATAALGLRLIQSQGFDLSKRLKQKTAAGEAVGTEFVEAIGLALSGLFLLFPGLISDTIGFLFLVPSFRRSAAAKLAKGFASNAHGTQAFGTGFYANGEGFGDTGPIIDGEADEVKTPDQGQKTIEIREKKPVGPENQGQ